MTQNQKINMIVDSLKKNSERPELKNWVIQYVEEDATFDRSSNDAVTKLVEKMEQKFKVSNWKRAGNMWKEILEFKQDDDDTPKKYMEKFNIMETKLKNSNCTISNILLAQHFLRRSKLGSLSIQNILSKVDMENEANVLKDIKKKYEILINSSDDEVKTKTAFYGNRSAGPKNSNINKRYDNNSDNRGDNRERGYGRRERSRSRSSRFQRRGKSRSRSRGGNERSSQESSYVAFTCEKFNLPDSDFAKNPEELNIFKVKLKIKLLLILPAPKLLWEN